MKVHLLFADRDEDGARDLPKEAPLLRSDLALDQIWDAMASEDKDIRAVAERLTLSPLTSEQDIAYRQAVLRDALQRPDVIRVLYAIAVEALQKTKTMWGISSIYMYSTFSGCVSRLQMFCDLLEKLRMIAQREQANVHSAGMINLFAMLERELSADYLSEVRLNLKELKFTDGTLLSASLGDVNQSTGYVLRRQLGKRFRRTFTWATAPSFSLHPRDDNGARDLSGKIDCAIAQITNTLWKSAVHVEQFFGLLKQELAFYIGCLNLRDQLVKRGLPYAIPNVADTPTRVLNCDRLFDCSLALVKPNGVVGNQLAADGRNLILISGANQGGKSTFLRSLGQAQLMAQCGMFVCAASLNISLCDGVYTHFKKEEDAKLESGKLDEELSRMSDIVDSLRPGGLVLCNESFSSTNEREGSEIHRQIVDALLECGVYVVAVSHMYEFVAGYYRQARGDALFLQPQRTEDGARTYRLQPGIPTPTSYGEDIYQNVFADAASQQTVAFSDHSGAIPIVVRNVKAGQIS